MELTDGTITLRRPTDVDAVEVTKAVHDSLEQLGRWMPWATDAYDLSTALAWIRGEIDPTEHPFLIVGPAGSIVGSCGLNRVDDPSKVANLGYWLHSDYTGRGWATAAVLLVARYAFGPAGLHRVEIIMSTSNEPSRRVAQKAGAHHEGILRETLLLHDTYHDAHLYSLLASDLR